MRPLRAAALVAFALATGCNLVPPTPAEPAPREAPPTRAPVAVAAPAPQAPARERFGKPIIAAEKASLDAVAADPKSFNHRVIVTEGIVKKVCQEAGCWMAIASEGHDALVRMENHAFFIPKSAAGRRARVQGRVLLVKDGKECDEAEAEHAQLSMEATGVELASN